MNQALLIVDVQNDFLEEGALAVKGSNPIVSVINELMQHFEHILTTRDLHPENHISFASRWGKKVFDSIQLADHEQILWPDHCIVDQWGAQYPKGLDTQKITKEFFKGTDPDVDSYSVFFNQKNQLASDIDAYLQKHAFKELYIVGLATDYCVKKTVLDALTLGYNVSVIVDGCRAVHALDGQKALEEMQNKGALVIQSQELLISLI